MTPSPLELIIIFSHLSILARGSCPEKLNHLNPGTSVANAAEKLAGKVCQQFQVPPVELVWVAHYPGRGRWRGRALFKERFDSVTFELQGRGQFGKPMWTPAMKRVVERLTEEAL